jgi:hypothetical protein
LLEDSITSTVQFIIDHLNDRTRWYRAEVTVLSYLTQRAPADGGANLESRAITLGNVSYHIHGIVHGGSPGRCPSARVKKFIQERARQYAGSLGLNLLCEERFSRYWGLDHNTDIDDIANTPPVSDRSKQIFEEWSTFRADLVPELIDLRYRISRVVRRALDHALHDEHWTGVARALFEELPYPLILEDEPSDLAEFYSDLLRSRYMADYMVSYAALTDVTSLHALVGLGHEREVGYFIQNPDATPADCILSLSAEGESGRD